jgi:non-canonical purine NTP pyrophosphatase, rdgB/HAM1 family
MKEILIATKNPGKAGEFAGLFHPFGVRVETLLDHPELPEVEETGATFQENARLKAETISRLLKKPVLADDSGLMIGALGGRPGVFSARYAGENKDDQKNIEKVLAEMAGIPAEKRNAEFVCILALAIPGEETRFFKGTCSGIILTEKRGHGGFGYDPIFYVPEKGKTFAEMTGEEKNAISHRGRAMENLEQWLRFTAGEGGLFR